MAETNGEIDIVLEAEAWENLPEVEALVEKAAIAALKSVHPRKWKRLSAVVLLADDATLQRLNHGFRGRDKPTNVLSFPASPVPGIAKTSNLGDIALAYETCAREAAEEGKPLAAHMMHLVVHGILHLLDYDHETDAEAEVMEAREIAILASLGIADPYAGAEGGARE
jgi:probable rRNA maturation factor